MLSREKLLFSNTKSHQQMRNMLYAFMVIMAIEMVIAIIIVHVLTTNISSFLIISGIIIFAELFLVFYYIVPLLKSAHLLGENGLTICLGRYFKTTVPWKMIERIEPVLVQVSNRDTLGLILFRKDENLYCMATNQGGYVVSLISPMLVKVKDKDNPKSKRGMVTSIFINVDDNETFAKALKNYITNHDTEEIKTQESGLEEKNQVFSSENIRHFDVPAQTRVGTPLLKLQNLSYQYGNHKAVDKLSLTVQKGEIFALLGPNGAGKSTTLKMLTGLLKPKSGHILLDGQDIWVQGSESIRKQIGYVPDQPILYFRLTAKEHLYYSGKLLGLEETVLMDRINHLLELFDLVPYQEQMIETYSQGMQRKVSMCLALLNDPQLLIVDELTNAYDAKTIAIIKKIFKERKAAGKTMLFSGHVMAVMEELADYIVIIQKGICYASGTMAELTAQYGSNNLEDLFLQLTDAQINDQVG
jgi:ABC-2 type transport system ATP-binding protein